ncbi:DUF4381 domain-containing protein [Reinekea sp.]|jgi:hypothetical protein|uniref:DUF4381 domain-containing protein n=1 Tax=Reinekea sp. TaxID=1970455 RepID=UPI003988DCED
MASLIFLANQISVPPELLEQLAPNDPITVVSPWPLAIGYWIVLIIALALFTAFIFYWRRTQKLRTYLKQLKTIRRSKSLTQCSDVHLLLRKVLQNHSVTLASCNDKQFSQYILSTLQTTELPAWVNAHYRDNQQPTLPWSEIKQLVKLWTKEAPQ